MSGSFYLTLCDSSKFCIELKMLILMANRMPLWDYALVSAYLLGLVIIVVISSLEPEQNSAVRNILVEPLRTYVYMSVRYILTTEIVF